MHSNLSTTFRLIGSLLKTLRRGSTASNANDSSELHSARPNKLISRNVGLVDDVGHLTKTRPSRLATTGPRAQKSNTTSPLKLRQYHPQLNVESGQHLRGADAQAPDSHLTKEPAEAKSLKLWSLRILGQKHMATGAVAAHVGDVPPLSDGELKEIAEYEKIVRIRDEIVAGVHRRLRRPAIGKTVAERLALSSLPDAVTRRPAAQNEDGSNPFVQRKSTQDVSKKGAQVSTAPTGLESRTAASSQVGPALVGKPNTLDDAEITLRRQRIEETLKDQLQQSHWDVKQNRFPGQDALPDFDVSLVLKRAHEVVPHRPLSAAPHTSGASDSFDENSFYSSQHDSFRSGDSAEISTSRPELEQRQEEQTATKKGAEKPARYMEHMASLPAGADATTSEANNGRSNKTGTAVDPRGGIPLGHEAPFEGKNGLQIFHQRLPDGPSTSVQNHPVQASVDSANRQGLARTQGSNGGVQQDVPSSAGPPIVPTSQTSPDVPVRRNHISSPEAPRPARISPLVVARAPAVTRQERPVDTSAHHTGSGSQSPPDPTQLANPRKRRRTKQEDTKSRKLLTRQVPPSPEPNIKQEPVSPPVIPMSNFGEPRYRPRGGASPLDERALYADILFRPHAIGRERASNVQRYEREAADTARYAESARALPRAYRAGRNGDDADAHEGIHAPQPRHIPTPSLLARIYSPVEAPNGTGSGQATYGGYSSREELGPTLTGVNGVHAVDRRDGRSRSPPFIRERPLSPQYDHTMMGPPLRRTAVEGLQRMAIDDPEERFHAAPRANGYRSSMVPSGRESVMEPPRPVNGDHVYERVRMPVSGRERIYEDPRYMEELPPPPVQPRLSRVFSPSVGERIGGRDYRVYRQREYTTRPATEYVVPRDEYWLRDYGERRRPPSHFDEAGAAYEQPMRVHSVRPSTARMERGYLPMEPREYAGSVAREVAPRGTREYSLRGDEPPRRELVPAEPERYAYLPRSPGLRYAPERSYVERVERPAPGPERPVDELPPEHARRTSYRYGAFE